MIGDTENILRKQNIKRDFLKTISADIKTDVYKTRNK